MGNFLGYFFKATKTSAVFPNQYIMYDTYSTTPNHREEIKAYRDENTRELYRITADGMKTSIKFSTRDKLHKADKETILAFFTNAEAQESDSYTAWKQRKVQLTYWNEEDGEYKTSYFYRPNLEFKINHIEPTRQVDNNNNVIYDIIYNSLDIELIEY